MSGSVFFEGNAYIDGGQIQNAVLMNNSIGNCVITTSSLDMNAANITSVKDPVNMQDAATKKYVDDLEIGFTTVSLTGTNTSTVFDRQKGSYVLTVTNVTVNGPTGVFHVSKSETSRWAHIIRTAACPGYMSNTTLMVSWPPNSGILLHKTGADFNGTYKVKIM